MLLTVFLQRELSDQFANVLFENDYIDHIEVSGPSGFKTNETLLHDGATNNASFLAASLAGYQGIGQYNVMLTQIYDVSVEPLLVNGKAEAYVNGRWSGNLEVVYTYNVIPIPAAVWLFGSGLGLLGWIRRRQTA